MSSLIDLGVARQLLDSLTPYFLKGIRVRVYTSIYGAIQHPPYVPKVSYRL